MASDRSDSILPALWRGLAPVLLVVLAGSPGFGAPGAEWAGWYERSLEWRTGATPLPVPPEGLRLERGGATWLLESGEIFVTPPAPDGSITGLVFRGQGRFTLPVPDPRERENFSFRSGAAPREILEFAFTGLTLRSAQDLAPLLPAPLKSTMLEGNGDLEASHQRWFRNTRRDVDARVAAGRLTPGDDYLIAEFETGEFGPLTLEIEPFRPEPVRLERHRTANDHPEVWISQRTPDGGDHRPLIDITHAELAADLKHHGGRKAHDIAQGSRYGDTRQWPWTEFSATVTFVPRTGGLRAVPLLLEPRAEVHEVRDAAGRPLPFLRDHLGRRAVIIYNQIFDDSLVVLLDDPLPAGEEARLTVEYSIRTSNQVLGREWYPRPADRQWDEHTARIMVSHPKKIQIRASGRLESDEPDGRPARTVWVMERPCEAVGFSYGKDFKEVEVARDGLPTVTSFGTEDGITLGDIRRNVARDLLDCTAFLAEYLRTEPPVDRLLAARVNGFSQSYLGFVNLGVLAYNRESPGLSQLLRGREAAAQFWSWTIHWPDYRDQWLADALVDFSTLLAIEAGGEHEGYYEQIIRTFNAQMIPSQKGVSRGTSALLMMPEFDRVRSPVPGALLSDSEVLLLPSPGAKVRWEPKHLKDMGPIGLGFRSSPAEVPCAFPVYNMRRGVLVLHMLRKMLDNDPRYRGRDLFREVLVRFYGAHAGGRATTADFIDAVELVTGTDWDWFFDQWVFGRGTPTLTWGWQVSETANASGAYQLVIEVEKRDVPPGFRVLLPVWAEFGDGRASQVVLPLEQAEQRFEFRMPYEPERLIANPRHEVLAEVLEKE